jgi:hypothetical protein
MWSYCRGQPTGSQTPDRPAPARNLAPVDVVPQELTRVLLNLIGNGLYAVDKRSREGDGTFRQKRDENDSSISKLECGFELDARNGLRRITSSIAIECIRVFNQPRPISDMGRVLTVPRWCAELTCLRPISCCQCTVMVMTSDMTGGT